MARIYLFSFLNNTAIFLSALFIPLLAREKGVSFFNLGLIGVAYGLGSFVSFFLFGRLSDRRGDRKTFIVAGALACAFIFSAQVLMQNLYSLLAVRFLAGFAIGIYFFPLVAYTAELGEYKKHIAEISAFGSLGGCAGWLLAGMIGRYEWIFLFSGLFFLVSFFVTLKIERIAAVKMNIVLFPAGLIKKNFRLYLAFFLRYTGSESVWIIFPLYLASLGASKFWIGVVYAVNPLAQFFAMRWVGGATEKIKETRIIRWGLAGSMAVFFAYGFMPSYHYALPIALLLGASWGFLYVGSLIYLTRRNPEKATATGVLGSFQSLATIIGPVIGGTIAQFFGFTWVMFAATLFVLSSIWVARKL